MRRRGEMIKASIDTRIRDDNVNALRRALSDAKIAQAEAEGYLKGRTEGLTEGRELGFNEAFEMMLSILMDFKNGNRS